MSMQIIRFIDGNMRGGFSRRLGGLRAGVPFHRGPGPMLRGVERGKHRTRCRPRPARTYRKQVGSAMHLYLSGNASCFTWRPICDARNLAIRPQDHPPLQARQPVLPGALPRAGEWRPGGNTSPMRANWSAYWNIPIANTKTIAAQASSL